MNLTLTRVRKCEYGIFSLLTDETGKKVASTLEHAYPSELSNEGFVPKLPNGTYTCVRGEHKLDHMIHTFETFEITGVSGHTGVLFHVGNYNADSDGCVLLGHQIVNFKMITDSKNTFDAFMLLQTGLNSFILTVKES